MESVFYCLFAGVIILTAGVAVYTHKNAGYLLDFWAKENRYTIVNKRYAFWRGPFYWSGSQHTVYRVTVEDQQEHRKTGWVRLTSFTWVSGDEAVAVVWDTPKPPSEPEQHHTVKRSL